MSDEEDIKVTHLRLCECGKIAGHNSLCYTERIGVDQRVDRAFENAMADERRDRSDKRKARISSERRSARARQDDWQLVMDAREAEMLLSTVKAANPESGARGSESTMVGPTTQRLDDDPRWRLAKRQLRRAAEQLLDLADEIRGHGVAVTATVQLGEHKDAEILACVGLKPREVVQHLGREVAGGTRTVERVREAVGDCRWCGRDWPK